MDEDLIAEELQVPFSERLIDDTSVRSRTVRWTESAQPLPSPPPREFENIEALHTIHSHPELFTVSTPVNVDRFEKLLRDHPNQPFVRSVCRGLREGFWPFADTHYGEWPLTWDNSQQAPKSEHEASFIRQQIQKEVEMGRFSPSFGPDLLPGMYSMPIHAVPKPGVNKFRLVTDHSSGEYALNKMILREDITGVTLDNIQDLGSALRFIRRADPEADLVLWKADVSEAYRQMPMHPLWQIKQVVSFANNRHVDRRNVFGGRASQRIFHAFMSLVIWIAAMKLIISSLFIYVDDSFSAQKRGERLFYGRYAKYLPSNLVRLLRLWDYIGLPHKEEKQVYGDTLPILGLEIDPNRMFIRMILNSKFQLIDTLRAFAKRGMRHSPRDFQRIAGDLNWALNVYPHLRPRLRALYAKAADELRQRAFVRITRDIKRDLSWITHHLANSDGNYSIKTEFWSYQSLPDSVLQVYCDASPIGLAFWFPATSTAFQSSATDIFTESHEPIFYLKALCVCAALLHAAQAAFSRQRIAVFTDNMKTVQMFTSFSAPRNSNWMLIRAVDAILEKDLDVRVLHVPSIHNTVADALSRLVNREAMALEPHFQIHSFQPPQDTLGVTGNPGSLL